MIASIAMFNTYSGNFEDSGEAVLLKTAFLDSAEEIAASYLGFDPNLRAYTDLLASGTGMRRLYLPRSKSAFVLRIMLFAIMASGPSLQKSNRARRAKRPLMRLASMTSCSVRTGYGLPVRPTPVRCPTIITDTAPNMHG